MIVKWKKELLQPIADELRTIVAELATLQQERQSLSRDGELEILKHARIVGATTSGAAKYREILSVVAPDVVLVEEAGEVLEAHVLTSLAEATEEKGGCTHLIMIGDHEQLRPKVEQYRLTSASGRGHSLDCSLFERLIQEGHPFATLNVQRRMRPSISALIRAQTYPSLIDHESVCEFPDLRGVTENVMFIDHRMPEDGIDAAESKSKANFREAELCVEIVKYFLLQGYRTDQIVVLTPYLGQLAHLITLIQKNLREITILVGERDALELERLEESVVVDLDNRSQTREKAIRCSSIDNFQGEEADIIVASLVRSNERGSIGFMKAPQRVNVLLSRARHGMVLVGNSATLKITEEGRAVWDPILEHPSFSGHIFEGLPTVCQLHPKDEPVYLSEQSQFRELRPNGGCQRPCDYRLNCGHGCPMMCHPTDRSHQQAQFNCCEPCKRVPDGCPSNHPCPKLCKERCGPCLHRVGPARLDCGHTKEDAMCHEVCTAGAREKLTSLCNTRVPHRFEPCGHEAETTCTNSRSSEPRCPASCGKLLACGHACMIS